MYSDSCALAVSPDQSVAVDCLDLEAEFPAFHRCAAVAVAAGAQARDKAVFVEQGAALARVMLAAAVGMLMTPHASFAQTAPYAVHRKPAWPS